ncbi:MAG: L,D-transpeptidase family protein [Candidatus Doudnabacteria bacterium]
MDKFYSSIVSFFTTKINTIFAFGVICFLGISISTLIISAYSDPSLLVLGIQTVNADVSVPPMIPPEQPAVVPEKHIYVSLKDQTLVYMEGDKLAGEFRISSGLPATPTPPGEYTVLKKKPTVNYNGATYSFPNTKWNLMFKTGPLNYYIHGAFWHHNFGHPMSHGCINVSYGDMEGLYNWADEGTNITIIADSLYTLPNMSAAIYPTPPGVIVASKVASSSLTISWNAALDPNGVTGYQIYQDSVLIATTTEPKYEVTGLTPDTVYQFEVFADNASGGTSFQSEKLSVTTPGLSAKALQKLSEVNKGLVAGAATINPAIGQQAGLPVQSSVNPDANNAIAAEAIQTETAKLIGSLNTKDAAGAQTTISNLKILLDALQQKLAH